MTSSSPATTSSLVLATALFATTAALRSVSAQTTTRPNEAFNATEYAGVAMGALLQAAPASVKYAIVMGDITPTQFPDVLGVTQQFDFRDEVFVTNPHTTLNSVNIDLFAPNGTLLQTTTLTIAPLGFASWPVPVTFLQTFRYCMVRVTSPEDKPIVGAVASGASRMVNPNNAQLLHQGDLRSWQQLQAKGLSSTAYVGPFSFLRSGTTPDEIDRSYGLGYVMNPNKVAHMIVVEAWVDGVLTSTRTVTLAPLGSLVLDDIWLQQVSN
nr:hypothetical protein [Planctomycetota bacterium]